MRIPRPISFALRISTIEGSIFNIYWNIVVGTIINGLMLALGARPLHMAILNGLPLLSQVFMLPAAKIIQTRDIRKPFVLWCEGISRALWLLIPLIVFFPQDDTIRIWFVLIVSALSHTIHSGGAVGWLSWVSDLVPEQIRGFYFGVRAAITGLVGMIGMTVASSYADKIHEAFGYSDTYLNVLLGMVGISVIFAALSWVGLFIQPVKRMHHLSTDGWSGVWSGLTSPNGRRIAWAWVTFAFAVGITTGVYLPFMLDRLEMPMVSVAIYGWVALTISTVLTPMWGRLSDRFGYKNVLVVAWLGVFWQPLLFMFTQPETPRIIMLPWPVLLDAIVGGAFWPAFSLSQTNLVIAEAPSNRRAGLFAVLTAMAGLVGFIAAVLGGWIADSIGENNTIRFLMLELTDLRTPMFLGAILRLLAGFFILAIKEPPRHKQQVTSSEAFTVVWRMLAGKPSRR